MNPLKTMIDLLQQTYREWTKDRVPRLAAALSYYTIFSLAPMLIVVIAVAGLVFGREAVQGRLDEQIQSLIGAQGADMVQQMIQNVSQPQQNIVASIIGLATVVIGATGVFAQLQDTMNTVWNVPPRKGRGILNTIKDRLISFSMVLGMGFLLLVSLVISAAISAIHNYILGLLPGTEVILQILNILVSFGIIMVLFAMIYKILPDIKIEWRDVWIGAVFTALLFTVGKFLLGLYLGNSGVLTTYGAAGSLVIILVWIFYSAQILLFGAEFTQVFAKRYGSFAEHDPASNDPEKQPAGGGPENKPVPSEG